MSEFEGLEPSPAVKNFVKHQEAVKPALKLNVLRSFAISQLEGDLYSLELLKSLVAQHSSPERVLVLIDHGQQVEICRLADGSSAELFYKSLKRNVAPTYQAGELSEHVGIIAKMCRKYLKADMAEASKYFTALTAEMKADLIIPRSYLQRNVIGVACFRRSTDATETFNQALVEAVRQGFLIDKPIGARYNSNAKLYQINLEALGNEL